MMLIKIWTLTVFTVAITLSQNFEHKLDKYYTYDEMTTFLDSLARNYVNLTKLRTIGRTHEGRELWVLEIAGGSKDMLLRPNVKLIGNIHGNEPVGKEILLYFAQYLLKEYTKGNERIRRLLDYVKLHILPSLNPDGFVRASNRSWTPSSCQRADGRENALGIDLNRNFPDLFESTYRKSQAETIAVMEWLRDNRFLLSASLHAGSLVAVYPYDNKENNVLGEVQTPDDDVFKHLAQLYAKKHPTMHLGKACPKSGGSSHTPPAFPNGIINGAEWFSMKGGMQDYNYKFHGCMELTLEISCCRYPSSHSLNDYWNENQEALLSFTEEARRGIRGLVLDDQEKAIPNATLYILGRDARFYTSKNGEFWRILLPNVYQLHVEALGFEATTVTISVKDLPADKWPQLITITLVPIGQTTVHTSWSNASLETGGRYHVQNKNKSVVSNYSHVNRNYVSSLFRESKSCGATCSLVSLVYFISLVFLTYFYYS